VQPEVPFEVVKRSAPQHADAFDASRQALASEIRAWAAAHGGEPPRWSDWSRAYALRLEMPFEQGWPTSAMVVAAFGSWDAALTAAGFAPSRTQRARKARKAQLRKRNRRRERLLELRREGRTNAEIAEILGLKPGHVSSLFSTMRADGIDVPPGQPRWPGSRA
jgi:DNA-binding CsgD family transcriptional regulator